MAPSKINVFITSFPGAGLPRTLTLALPPTTTISALVDELDDRLPEACTSYSSPRLRLSTVSSRIIPLDSPLPLSHFLPSPTPSPTTTTTATTEHHDDDLDADDNDEPNKNDFLTLRLTFALPGGKGGFGSQLRAAGGRMSKRKKGGANANPADEHGSSRNLDGRRLRTVTEAKALAEYLAIRPEMERKEKEKRRQRWEQIVESTERRQEEIRHGSKNVGLDGRWVEEKEEAGERTREAVREVMRRGGYRDNLAALGGGEEVGEGSGAAAAAAGSSSSADEEGDEGMEDVEGQEESGGSKATTPEAEPEPEIKGKGKEKEVASGTTRKFFGFDEDDEFMSSDEDSEAEEEGAKA